MTKGEGRFVTSQDDRPAGRFPRMVYAVIYLNTASLQRKFPNFGMGRPTRVAEQEKTIRNHHARRPTNQQRGETKPPHTPRRTDAERKQTPNAKAN